MQMRLKKIFLGAVCAIAAFLGAAEKWQLIHVDGDRSELRKIAGRTAVVKEDAAGGFELIGEALPASPGGIYDVEFTSRTAAISGAYVNFYLRGEDDNGKAAGTFGLAPSPGRRGLIRSRMSRLEVPSDHDLTHRFRIKCGKRIRKLIPVFEASDGKITLFPGTVTLRDYRYPRETAAEFTVKAGTLSDAKCAVWSSFELMPQVDYRAEVKGLPETATAELRFFDAKKQVILSVPLKSGAAEFRVPALALETELALSGSAGTKFPELSGTIRKNFKVDFKQGVYGNEWQGTELLRGDATGRRVAFRRVFELAAAPEHAAIRFIGHDEARLFVNGHECGRGDQFDPGVCDITAFLNAGKNVIAIECRNSSGQLRTLFDAYIREKGGRETLLVSDSRTKYADAPSDPAWQKPDFDDSAWKPATLGGSPKDFGASIIATRINNRHPRLAIGPGFPRPAASPAAPGGKPAQFEVVRRDGRAILLRDGKPIPGAMFCHQPRCLAEIGELNRKAGIKLHMLFVEAPTPDEAGKYDFSAADAQVSAMVAQLTDDPEAYVIVTINSEPPKNFAKRPKYQSELTRTSKGEFLRITPGKGGPKFGTPYTDPATVRGKRGTSSVSHASKAKIAVYEAAIRATVRHFEESPFAPKIAGYGLCGEMDGQWHLYAPYGGLGVRMGMADYSDAMRDYFRAYLRCKYGSDAKLQEAWEDAKVTFDTAEIPGYEERVGNDFFVSQRAADYAEAFALAESELLSAVGRAVKSELKRKAIVWVYTKDSYRDVGLNQFLPHTLNSGSGFEQYTSRDYDSFGNPTDYYFRRNGLPPANRGCAASANLNGKLREVEMDLRSYLTQVQQAVYGGETAMATENHFRNVVAAALLQGSSFRFYSFWTGWYNNDGVMECIRRMSDIEREQLSLKPRWLRKVCLFYDDRAITHVGNFDTRGVRTSHYYYAKSVTATGADLLNRAGIGADIYYLRDLLNPDFPADQYEIFLFSGVFRFTPEVLAAVNTKLRRDGKILVFPWGSGFLNAAHRPDAASVEEATGIAVTKHPIQAADGTITRTDAVHPLTAAWEKGATLGARTRYNITKQLPMFAVNDPKAVVLGRFGDGSAALAVKKVGNSYSLFCAAPQISPALLRSLCKARGVHVFVNNDWDFVATDGNFMSIHSAAGGKKTVALPEKVAKAVDWFTGRTAAENTDRLELTLRDDETVILRLYYDEEK